MPFNTTTGVYTPASGGTGATSGLVIASATWNSVNSDVASNLTTLGKAVIPLLASFPAYVPYYYTSPVICNFAATAGTDIGTFNINTPTGAWGFRLGHGKIYAAGGNLGTTNVSLYTGPNATGTVVISSTATTVTTNAANTNNNMQILTPTSQNTVGFSASINKLFLHVTTSNAGTSSTASVQLRYDLLP